MFNKINVVMLLKVIRQKKTTKSLYSLSLAASLSCFLLTLVAPQKITKHQIFPASLPPQQIFATKNMKSGEKYEEVTYFLNLWLLFHSSLVSLALIHLFLLISLKIELVEKNKDDENPSDGEDLEVRPSSLQFQFRYGLPLSSFCLSFFFPTQMDETDEKPSDGEDSEVKPSSLSFFFGSNLPLSTFCFVMSFLSLVFAYHLFFSYIDGAGREGKR